MICALILKVFLVLSSGDAHAWRRPRIVARATLQIIRHREGSCAGSPAAARERREVDRHPAADRDSATSDATCESKPGPCVVEFRSVPNRPHNGHTADIILVVQVNDDIAAIPSKNFGVGSDDMTLDIWSSHKPLPCHILSAWCAEADKAVCPLYKDASSSVRHHSLERGHSISGPWACERLWIIGAVPDVENNYYKLFLKFYFFKLQLSI